MFGLRSVDKAFGEKQILKDFSIALAPGRQHALMGPSGTGKTTILRLLAGMERPDQGEVYGLDQQRIAYQFQEDRLLPWYTVTQNLALFTSGPVEPWLEAVGLIGEAQQYPHQLSGGMQRRLALARALAYDGDVVLLDEPLKELDMDLRERMMRLIYTSCREKTLILVTHHEGEAHAICDHWVTLSGSPLQIQSDKTGERTHHAESDKKPTDDSR